MAKYQWNSPALKKKKNAYGWISMVVMATALVCALWLTIAPRDVVVLLLVGVATIFFWLSSKAQQDDKKLKKQG